jgi:hypothetical protein
VIRFVLSSKLFSDVRRPDCLLNLTRLYHSETTDPNSKYRQISRYGDIEDGGR